MTDKVHIKITYKLHKQVENERLQKGMEILPFVNSLFIFQSKGTGKKQKCKSKNKSCT